MLLLSFLGWGKQTPKPIHKINAALQGEQINADLDHWRRYRLGLRECRAFAYRRTDLFPPHKLLDNRLLTREQKDEIRSVYSSILDYTLALDSLGAYHSNYRKIGNRHNRHGSFLIAYGSFLAQYIVALDFIARCDNDPAIDTILNEEMPEYGVPKNSYAKFRFRFLSVARATEFTALEAVYKARMKDAAEYPVAQQFLREDAERLWAQKKRGALMTVKNAGRILKKGGFTAYFPIQKNVADWMGETKVYRRGEGNYLMRARQIEAMIPRLQPGDILLSRREWHLSNIGLPGYWTHAMLYIGTPAQRQTFFADSGVRAFVRSQGLPEGQLEAMLERDYPDAYNLCSGDDGGHPVRILEAIGPGVVFRSLADGANADSLAALRPRLPKAEIAKALHRAFSFAGRPYDFNFDFQTDTALVCSELIYKAYEPMADQAGLVLSLKQVAGRFVLPPNEIARQYADTAANPERQLDFVFFFDGNEKKNRTDEKDSTAFAETWKRPKWRSLAQRIGKAATKDKPVPVD